MSETASRLEAIGLEQGDVCMWEIQYSQVDNNLKVWVEKLVDGEVTIVDGLAGHPYSTTGNLTFVSQLLAEGDEFEVGDKWNNITKGGSAYIFFKAKATGAYMYFNYGQKNLLPKWAIIAIIVASAVVLIGCLIICFCYVRRLYRRKKNSMSKVKKLKEETTEQRLSRYKYKPAQATNLPNYG